MQTFFAANLGLAPFAVFWLAIGPLGPRSATIAGLLLSLVIVGWRARKREFRILEAGGLALFAALGAGLIVAPQSVAPRTAELSFIWLGALGLISVALGRPWTAEYSRAAFAAEAESPIFHWVNQCLSGFWGVMFLAYAGVRAAELGLAATLILFALGVAVSILAPKALIRFALKRQIEKAEPYRWRAPAFGGVDRLDVAVVGAGIGGLTAAALLAEAGLKVAVYEAHVVPGGFCHTFLRKARHQGQPCVYRFDAGPHDFSGLFPGGPLTRTLDRLGVADVIEWRRLDHSYFIAGERIDPPRDWREYVRLLGDRFPEDAAGLTALFEELRAIYDGLYSTGEAYGGIPGLPASVDELMAFPRRHPLTVRWMDRPFDELVARHVTNAAARSVIGALTGYISDGRQPLTCGEMVPIFGYYFHGGYYPAGGSDRVAEALVAAIEARGGAVHLKTRVERIVVENGQAAGVRLADRTFVAARAVVSNADTKRTFGELVEPAALPADFGKRIAEAAPGPSAFMVHLGVDYVPEGRPALHLGAPDSLGVEILSKIDPSAAPPGHATIGIIKILTHDEARTWFPAGRSEDWKALRFSDVYEAQKRALGDAMIAAAETVLPGLSAHIVYRSEASPVTYARYDHASAGAIYGIAQSGRLSGAKSPVPGLVVAGAATHGPGVEAVVISGARAAEALVPGLLARPMQPVMKAAVRIAA